MICQRCLKRASALSSRIPQIRLVKPIPSSFALRPFSNTISRPSSTPAPEPPAPGTAESPVFSTPLGDVPTEDKPVLSACPEGTVLTGLNYFKNQTDPVALPDDAYPTWLWKCLEVQKKADEGADEDAGDEFSKSKKQRRLAAKRQRALEARLLAEGNIEALAPKIPLQHQSINLPANEEGSLEGALAAQQARENLRKSMRKERKAKIKETNYLKSM
ncbi:mitochondrial ribosomal protein L37-domain-containing protein [Hypoxylon rubiginosum]|uniref:Mitochondrial ribosomal protein L37-domain-containing protein n=1 Tax=Hypoxylon rubiginosum TaxID=110542 RepID=A0ACC0DKV1_9PEZI|nr:mitochondrial ribosomal protein L37-domain-containing protein [Hypoxylon rubiginosum]